MGSGRGRPALCSLQLWPALSLIKICPCTFPTYRFCRSLPLTANTRSDWFCNPPACQLPLLSIPLEPHAARQNITGTHTTQVSRVRQMVLEGRSATLYIIIPQTIRKEAPEAKDC